MKKLLTTEQIREQYDPDSILKDIEKFYEMNLEKLISCLKNQKSPLLNYSANNQISFLESRKKDDVIINKVASLLKDTIYFMMLSKKERTNTTQRMRRYYSTMLKHQSERINMFLDDPEIGAPRHSIDSNSKHKAMSQVRNILSIIQKSLNHEKKCRVSLARSGYLTGLQISMGKFFFYLNNIGMSQKDQISLVQNLFDDFDVDWDEGDRENIKLSLQKPALEYFKKNQSNLQQLSGELFSSSINDALLSNLIDHVLLLNRRVRRF